MNRHAAPAPVVRLCLQCGLCCNGVLFADVRLQKGDAPRRLTGLGLALKKKAGRWVLPQPCAGLDGTRCRIYAGRPAHCRAFECGLLKRVQAGELSVMVALEKIAGVQRRAEKARELLRRLGDQSEELALIRRYARVMRKPIDLSGPEDAVERRGELMLAVNDIMRALQDDFLK